MENFVILKLFVTVKFKMRTQHSNSYYRSLHFKKDQKSKRVFIMFIITFLNV